MVITVEQATLTLQQQFNKHQDRAKTCQALINLFTGLDNGDWRGGIVEVQQGAGVPGSGGVAASTTITYSGSSGTQTVRIGGTGVNNNTGGTVVTFQAGTTDAATVQNAIAAIRADPVMKGLIFIPQTPTYNFNMSNVLTMWANTIPVQNLLGNFLTMGLTGTGATPVAGATFAGGVNAATNGFSL